MLGSEVIKQIQNLIDEYGDLPIEISLNGSDQEEVKEICYGGYGKFSNKPDRKYITLLSFIQQHYDMVYFRFTFLS